MRNCRGFTLAECMIALLFLSIALFGYVSLHIRLIHSGLKLEQREFRHGLASKKIGRALFGEFEVPPKLVYRPFDYLKGVELTKVPPTPPPFAVPDGVEYHQAMEEWKDRNGTQSILLDSCRAQRHFVGW